MSKAVNNLRTLEKKCYAAWWSAVRICGESRNALSQADLKDVPAKKGHLTMAVANADRAFSAWIQVCEALDEVELNNHWQNGRSD